MNILILLSLVYYALGQETEIPRLDGRIIGGSAVNIADYPYQISLELFSSHICGGAIISSNYVLTAAHCVTSAAIPSLLTVRVGTSLVQSGGQVYTVLTIISHPNYSSSTYDYDIAILQLSSSISATNAASIPLPSLGTGPTVNSTAVVTGWGVTSEGGSTLSSNLQMVQVPVVSQSDCSAAYIAYGSNAITDRMFCAGYLGEGGKDACQGDSGGPIVVNGTLYGLVSWGVGCARAEYPGVYTNLANLRDWITANSGV